jgi:HlyD family secretion protein
MIKKKRLIALGAIVLVAATIGAAFWIAELLKPRNVIKVSGNIEGNDVRISFRVAGQIQDLLADEGSDLRIGQIVARLNTDELTKIQKEAEAQLKAAEFKYRLSKDDLVRFENLYLAGAVSQQRRDQARTQADTDWANVKHMRAQLELENTRLGWADLASPLNGYILVKSAEQGENVLVGAPVFTAVDLNNVWVTAYINETDVGKVKLNQKATVKIDAFPKKSYKGWVSYISQQEEFTPKYIQTTTERVKLVYRIKVRVDNSGLEMKPGMPADAYITVE